MYQMRDQLWQSFIKDRVEFRTQKVSRGKGTDKKPGPRPFEEEERANCRKLTEPVSLFKGVIGEEALPLKSEPVWHHCHYF